MMTESEITERFRRYIKEPLQIKVCLEHDEAETIHIEITDGVAHACIRPVGIDFQRWSSDDGWYKYYARCLITEWAYERYLAK